ncbi:phage tail length tape measure family protein [Roseibium litorale]|uniref:Phage tail length tape measure family protein n=1 Tax=Roseibium litorale TaxID=2803841 RepID=A0ABR9CH12_9HYPH|nr:phage tail length tape measure family protein [Roseibium litorale]MBD8890146.1 phage tail length tape measure family protein [Roseibium litorale]
MTLQLKMLASLDASGVERGARAAQSHLRLVSNEAEKTGARLSQALDAQLGIGSGSSASDRARDIEAYGTQLDDLRAKFNPLYALQRRYEASVKEIAEAHKVGAISAQEAASATAQATGVYRVQQAALAGSAQVLGQLGSSSKLAASEVNILGQQFADAGIQIASGQSIFTAILQQGSQVQFMLGSKGVNTIGGAIGILKQGLIGFLNPINLALVGLAGTAAAASALYRAVANDETAEDALENQNELIQQMADRYKDVKLALDLLDRSPTRTTITLDTDQLEQRRETLLKLISEIETSVQRSLNLEANALTALAEPLTADAALFREFQGELRAASNEFVNAETGADQLIARLVELARTAPDTESEAAIRTIIAEARTADTGLFDLVKRLNEVEAALRGVDAAASAIGSVSTAANGRVGAAFSIFEEQAAKERLAAELGRGQKKSAGKTDRTEERTRDFIEGQDEELARLKLETQLIGAGDAARARALATLEAEIRIRNLGIDALGAEAQTIRDNAQAITESSLTLDQNRQAWETVQSAGESAIDALVDKLSNGDLAGAIQSIISNLSQLVLMLGAVNPLKNALLGTSLPTLSSSGGLVSGLLGGTSIGLSSALNAATFGLYNTGGATATGNDNDIAGFVHRNEYVFDARSVRAIGVPVLEAIRKGALQGYRTGGLVSGGVATTSAMSLPGSGGGRVAGGSAGSWPTREETQNGSGGVIINITTQDAQSFRASRTQIASEFARLTARGQRGV